MRRPPARVFIGTPAGSGTTGGCAVHVSPRYILLICWRYYFRGTGDELTATRAGTGTGVRFPDRILCNRFSCASHIDQYWRVPGFKILPYMYGYYRGQGSTRSTRKVTVEGCPEDPPMGMPADAPDLNRALLLMSTYGEVRNVIFEEASFSGDGPLSRLIPRQRDLLIAAKQYGYYEYPRKINSQQLAEKVGISKTTAIEHLRKAEARLIATLLAGY